MRGRDRVALACCAVTLGFCGLAFGGSVRWAALVATACALVSAVPYIPSRQRDEGLSPLTLVIVVAIGVTLLQLVPLPSALAGVIANGKLELVSDHARAWGEAPPSFVAASYDPPATLVELAKLCGYAALAFAALRISSHRNGRKALAMIVVGVGVAIGAVALAHQVAGATSIYGLVDVSIHETLVSPIVNTNHLASLLAVTVPVAIGLALASINVARVAWFGAATFNAAVALLASSRGGALGLGIGIAAVTALLLLQRRAALQKAGARSRSWLPALVIAGCVAVLIGATTGTGVFEEIASTHVGDIHSSGSKFLIWEKAIHMLQANPILGTGRGAFEPAFTSWSDGGAVSYSHAENSYVQPLVDWGIPGAIAIGVLMLALARRAVRPWAKSPLEAGALGGLIALAAHELADFSLELPIVAMLATIMFAILVPSRLFVPQGTPLSRLRMARGASIAAGALVCLLAATHLGQPAHAAAAETAGTHDIELAHRRANEHPADYLVMGQAAQALLDARDPRSLAVLTRALSLNPTHFGLHRLAAAMLMRLQRPEQAQGELALALRFAPDIYYRDLIEQVVATFPDPQQGAQALPVDVGSAVELMPYLTVSHHDALALAYAERLALLSSNEPKAQLLCAKTALASKRSTLAARCAREAYRMQPDASAASVLGSALAIDGDVAGGIAILQDALNAGIATERADRVRLLTALVDLQLASDALAPAAKTLEELLPLVTERGERIAVLNRRARLHDRLNEPSQAKWDRDLVHKLESGDSI